MRWVLFIPLVLLLAIFALSNTQPVELRMWPFDLAWASPLGVAVLILSVLAFLLGATIAWSAGLAGRRRAARIEQAAKLLEGELASYKAREEAARREADMGRAALPAASGEVVPLARRAR